MDTHQYTIHVDQRGRLVLPAGVRHQLGIEQGSTLIMAVQEDGVLRLITPGEAARRGRGLLRELAPDTTRDRQLAEELIAERRIEAEHE
ncbi:AbrB/MazE/SpoVT family DNA-binding domain-containing protein [Acidithiobacillus sulfuriphilus]|uniref:AbrB/MazE/SpoVT family DNA-binding domain-containing protein n=2 Tax=Acidithiobacillus sulfuriphilus TaxID=1867749 RepID=A0A3M8QUK7_9PROT|nr:AbrB/MazE/SpoVT family DNA-binding domain-containing protein [Acidithiobacillus sulfuriphilus]RNF58674.1 AbrB/MazE/SpoVT family DNA-binding domain-containing protein [Acidithiobacillus sulfuriphilus]